MCYISPGDSPYLFFFAVPVAASRLIFRIEPHATSAVSVAGLSTGAAVLLPVEAFLAVGSEGGFHLRVRGTHLVRECVSLGELNQAMSVASLSFPLASSAHGGEGVWGRLGMCMWKGGVKQGDE